MNMTTIVDAIEVVDSVDLGPRPGVLRKHVFASRGNFSFRKVITSLDDNATGVVGSRYICPTTGQWVDVEQS